MRFTGFLIVAALCLGLAAPATAQKLPLDQLSAYLNGLETVTSKFKQISDDGSVQTGTLYIRRPGRMRFEYDPPQKALVLASNQAVAIFDNRAKGHPEIYPLRRTPLSIILSKSVNLRSANMVVGHEYDSGYTLVVAQDPKNPDIGQIQMRFTGNPVALDGWTIFDAGGGRTTVILEESATGMELPRTLFDIDTERAKRGN